MPTGAAARVAGRIAVEVLLWAAVLMGMLWLATWLDVRPGPVDDDVAIAAGFADRALLGTALVLAPAVAALALWLAGAGAARLVAVVAGALVVATANGWAGADGAQVLEHLSLVVGVALLALTAYAEAWRQPGGTHRVPWSSGLLLTAVALWALLLGGQGALLGVESGLVNRRPEEENGYWFLVPGLALAVLGFAVLVRMAVGFPWSATSPTRGRPTGEPAAD